MNEFKNINRSLSDFFTKEILRLAIIPLIASILILYTLFFSAVSSVMPQNGNFIQIEETTTSTDINSGVTTVTNETSIEGGLVEIALNYILKSTMVSRLMSFLVYTVGSILVVVLSIFVSLIVISFLTPTILRILQNSHYPQIEIKSYGSFATGLWIISKAIFMMIFLFIVLIPFYFIPFINVIIFNIPFFYMFHKVLSFDISSCMMSEDDYARIKAKHGDSFVARSILLYSMSLIPFMGLFIPLFYVVYLGNSYFVKLEYLYNIDDNIDGNKDTSDKDTDDEIVEAEIVESEDTKLIENN